MNMNNNYNQQQGYNQGYGQQQNNYGINQNQAQQPGYYVNAKKIKPKRIKKKRKHRFLKFLLLCLVIYGGYKISGNILSKIAEKELNQFITDYPFNFDKSDSLWYITSNFNVDTSFIYNERQYEVAWISSNNKLVSIDEDGKATVNRPLNNARDITISVTYKKLWGKATKDFNLKVIPTNSLSESDISIITKEMIESKEYNREMQAVLDKDGNLKFMMGDFKNTYINSKEDALAVLKAYKDQFTACNIDFDFKDSSSLGIYTTYKFKVLSNDIEVSEASASVTILKDSQKLTKVSIDMNDDILNISDSNIIGIDDADKIIDKYTKENLKSLDYIIFSSIKKIYNSKIIYEYNIETYEGGSYKIMVQADNGEVISCESNLRDASTDDAINIKTKENVGNGYTEDGKYIEFDITAVQSTKWFGLVPGDFYYYLWDTNRNIVAYDNEGWWYLVRESGKKDANIFTQIGGIIDFYIEINSEDNIVSKTNTFEDSEAIQAYKNMQIIYDWYKDNLNLISFDGRGSEIDLRIRKNDDYDNASWNGNFKIFSICPAKKYKYSLGLNLEVLGHEFTHAVFQHAGASFEGSGEDIGGLSEAYADIMGCIVTRTDNWVIGNNLLADGTPIAIRDIRNIQNAKSSSGRLYPETYHGENWNGECHTISVVISHVASEMKDSGLFSWEDLANIWYNSLGLSYDSSSTYVTCRKYVIKTAEDLGYSDEQVDFIAKAFDDREIFDSSYIFKVKKSEEVTAETSSDGSKTVKTNSNAIDGDPIYDDSNSHRFLIAYSVLMSIINGEDIIIYEEGESFTKEEQEEFEKLLASKIEAIGIESLTGKKVGIKYKRISKWQMDIANKLVGDTVRNIKSFVYDSFNANSEDVGSEAKNLFDKYFKYAFDWRIIESTPYEFYDSLGLIE